MIILCIICILLGIGGLAYAGWTKSQCIKLDQNTIEQNQQLENVRTTLQDECSHLEYKKSYLESTNQHIADSGRIISEQNEVLLENQKTLQNNINQLTEQKQNLITEVEVLKEGRQSAESQIAVLNRTVDEMSTNLKTTALAAFEQYCDALEYEYQKREQEFDGDVATLDDLYGRKQDEHIRNMERNDTEFKAKSARLQKDLDIVLGELEKIRATRAAAMEAQLREEEIKSQATFYTLQLNDADKRDVAYLQSIEYNLREARPLRMLIWSTFYRDKVNDLAARVGAVGASGIYKITHIDSGISYIGQAKDIKERWVTHVKCSLGIDTPVTSQLYAFTREKGIDNFTFEVLEKCNINELNEKEKFYIDLYQTYDFGLNKTRGNG